MDSFSITTPSLLFPAISLLMLAFTNRFLAISGIIRQLHDSHRRDPNESILRQLDNLRRRVWLIRWMQAAGVLSLMICVVSMASFAFDEPVVAFILFILSLVLMMISLLLCLVEVLVSDAALNVLLSDIGDDSRQAPSGQ